MADFNLMRELTVESKTKIVLLVLDGLGGLPRGEGGETELETANTPHMNRLAREGCLGLSVPVRLGITPGSGPAHLGLFGYDPIQYDIGRGVLEAFGIGVPVGPQDVAARGNFCTVDANGLITDRRAGRIPTEKSAPIVERLAQIKIPGVEIEVKPVKEYRFVVVFRGAGLSPEVEETDPQKVDAAPLPAKARTPAAQKTADLFNQWIAGQAGERAGAQVAETAAQVRFHAHPQFTQIKRLGHVIVRAGAQTMHFGIDLVQRGQHHNGHVHRH